MADEATRWILERMLRVLARAVDLQERQPRSASGRPRFLIHDRDSKYSGPFDEVFRTDGASVIHTPIRAPRTNAFAGRWVRTIRTECLDRTLVRGRRHLERVLRTYTEHHNAGKPHRGLDRATPDGWGSSLSPSDRHARLLRRDILGGIHEYESAA